MKRWLPTHAVLTGDDVMDFNDAIKSAGIEATIKAKVRKSAIEGNDRDDLIQEARIALLEAVRTHDPKRGPLQQYAGWLIDNTLRDMFAQSRTWRRCPRYKDRNGKWRPMRDGVVSIGSVLRPGNDSDETQEMDPCTPPEEAPDYRLEDAQKDALMMDFWRALAAALDPREREMLTTRVDLATGEVLIPHVTELARTMGITRSKAEWSMAKIRGAVDTLLATPKFRDLRGHRRVRALAGPAVEV